MNRLAQFEHKQIVVLGLGLTGMSLVRFLAEQQLCFAVNDSRAQAVDVSEFHQQFPHVPITLGHWHGELIASADILLVSPGVDLGCAEIAPYIQAQCQVLGDVELFCQISQANIIAVTGSNGKSTVVSLLAHIAKQLGKSAVLAGNIGVPVLDTLSQTPDYVILELSSFQLETINSLQAVAASVLNVSDDHLDRHKTLAQYSSVKQKIYHQAQYAIINRDDPLSQVLAQTAGQKVLSFGLDAPKAQQFGVQLINHEPMLVFHDQQSLIPLISASRLALVGAHNMANCLAALALGYAAGWPLLAMVQCLADFTGLPHRCQRVITTDGITWLNDSKATNVGATIAAIQGVSPNLSQQQQLILIAGGEGKGADFGPLKAIFSQQVAKLIVLGKDAAKLAEQAEQAVFAESLAQAVALARSFAKTGDIVLLSPACASLDMFKNYQQRGEHFMALVQESPHD